MLYAESFFAVRSKLLGRRKRAPNLSAVDIPPRETVEVSPELGDVDVGATIFILLEHLEEIAPDLPPRLFIQAIVRQCEMDAGLEGLVHVVDPVRREDQDPFIVF